MKETEDLIILLQGESSENLIQVFALYSFFALQANKPEDVCVYQKKASRLALEAFGEKSQ